MVSGHINGSRLESQLQYFLNFPAISAKDVQVQVPDQDWVWGFQDVRYQPKTDRGSPRER